MNNSFYLTNISYKTSANIMFVNYCISNANSFSFYFVSFLPFTFTRKKCQNGLYEFLYPQVSKRIGFVGVSQYSAEIVKHPLFG